VNLRALHLFIALTGCLSVSCQTQRNNELRDWSSKTGLLENPASRVAGHYKNSPVGSYPYVSLWKSLTGRSSEPSDSVRIGIDSEARTFSAALIRADSEVDYIAYSYRDSGHYLRLQNQLRGHFGKFPLIYGVETVELAVGKSREGLSLYETASGSGFIVVFPVSGGGGPGGSVTFEQVRP
jgi:hypothetical protein